MQKNVAGQKWIVFAFDATDGSPKTGDAANITANLRRDGVQDAVADTNPTETERGQYEFDLEQGETDGDLISIAPESSTGNIEVVGAPIAVWTTAPYFNVLGIASDGDIIKVNTLHGHTAQTGDSYGIVNHGSYGNAVLVRASTPGNTLYIDGNNRIDIGKWLGSAVTLSTGNQPDVNVDRIDDVAVSTIATAGKLHVLDGSGAAISSAAKLLAYVQLLARKDAAIASDNSAEVTAINANEGSGAGSWSNQTEALEAIRDALVDSNPQNHNATANNETTGTLDSGTYTDTATINITYYQISPVTPAVGGFGLNVDLTFNIGTGRVPDQITVTGYFDAAAQRTIQIWAYDYNAAAYVQLSNTANDFGNAASNQTYQYPMTNNMRQASDGEIKIRFTSESITTGDDWYCDYVNVTSVAQEAAGLTADAIQASVWARADSGHDHNTLGHSLSSMFIEDALVVSVTSTSQFIIDTGIANNDAFNGFGITVRDETDGHHEIRRIVDYIGNTKEIFLDRALSFTPVAGDVVHVMGCVYADVNVTHVGATVQTALDIKDILDDTDELQTNQGAWATVTGFATETKQNTIDTVVDSILAMLDNTRGEPSQGAPPVNPDAMTKIDYLYTTMRNKKIADATSIKVYNDAGAVVLYKLVQSDDGTDYTMGEFISGA